MAESSLKEKTAKGIFWGGIGSGSLQLLNLIFGIFLSRLLSPSDYGMIGALTVFAAMAGTFAESGFILTIVNKKEARHEDYNAVFWFNMCMEHFSISFCLLVLRSLLISITLLNLLIWHVSYS